MQPSHSGPMAAKTVLVTGGSGGIGRATALGLATMGGTWRSAAGTARAPTARLARSAPPAAGRWRCS
jgi:NAD(P)-dependent dehydrogenase (short-subunit alcohol dehydrogenase family)